MPTKHSVSSTERNSLKLLNIECELDAAMRLMNLLDQQSKDLLEDLDFFEKQVTKSVQTQIASLTHTLSLRNVSSRVPLCIAQLRSSNEEALKSIQQEKDKDLIFACEDELFSGKYLNALVLHAILFWRP